MFNTCHNSLIWHLSSIEKSTCQFFSSLIPFFQVKGAGLNVIVLSILDIQHQLLMYNQNH